ncbi:MAG: S1C family serine protease [Planctomycetota bacterium]|jgi:serine protease Do
MQRIVVASALLAVALNAPITSAGPNERPSIHDVQDTFVKLGETLRPGVVALTTYKSATDQNGNPGYYVFSNGSGFVWDSNGLIVTNYHNVEVADRFDVTLSNGAHHEAFVVGADPRSDLAILRIEVPNLQVQPLAEANQVKPGQWVITLGNPLGSAGEDGQVGVSIGVVFAEGKSLTGRFGVENDNRNYDNMIQTTLDLIPGMSGGAVFNLDGEVIGIATARFAADDETPGVGFVIPLSQRIRSILRRLEKGETIRYGAFTARAETVNSETAIAMVLPSAGGAMITYVPYDSKDPVVRAGLQGRDVITQLAGERTVDADTLLRLCKALPVDLPFDVVYYRDGVQRATTLTLVDPPVRHAGSLEALKRMAFARSSDALRATLIKSTSLTP